MTNARSLYTSTEVVSQSVTVIAVKFSSKESSDILSLYGMNCSAGNSFVKELKVWQKAHQFVLGVYKETQSFPAKKRFGLTLQLRRSSVSSPSNIAEGCGYESEREFARYLQIAAGSASEAEYQLLLAHDLGYIKNESYRSLKAQVKEVKKMLHSFIKNLKPETWQLIAPGPANLDWSEIPCLVLAGPG